MTNAEIIEEVSRLNGMRGKLLEELRKIDKRRKRVVKLLFSVRESLAAIGITGVVAAIELIVPPSPPKVTMQDRVVQLLNEADQPLTKREIDHLLGSSTAGGVVHVLWRKKRLLVRTSIRPSRFASLESADRHGWTETEERDPHEKRYVPDGEGRSCS